MVAMIHGAAPQRQFQAAGAPPGGRWLRSSRLFRFPSPPAGGGWRIIRMPGIFLLTGRPRDVFNEPQDIYMELTMGGEFPGEVL